MRLEVKVAQIHRVEIEDVDTSEEFTVGAVVEALQHSGRLPKEMETFSRKDLVIVVYRHLSHTWDIATQDQTWSSLDQRPDDTILLVPRFEEALHLFSKRSQNTPELLVVFKNGKENGSLTPKEYQFLMQIALNPKHYLHSQLKHLQSAFAEHPDVLIEEAKDVLAASVDPYFSPRTKEEHPFATFRRFSHQQSQPNLSSQSQHTSMSKIVRVGLQHDIMWILSTLIIAFFSFMAALAHIFFIEIRNSAFSSAVYFMMGLVALYEVFGYRSLLGYDPLIQTLGRFVSGMLTIFFLSEVGYDAYLFFEAPKLKFSELSTDFFGTVVSLVWLAALQFSWKTSPECDSVMAVILILMALFCTSIVDNLLHMTLG